MDPNAEQPPPTVQVTEVEVDFGLREQPIIPPLLAPPLSSSIFRDARGPESDPERIRQMQEEEFKRKLRGEYEKAQQRVGEIVYSNMERPLRLSSIRLSPPPPTTRSTFLQAILSPFLTSSSTSTNFLYPTANRPPETLHEILLTTKGLVAHLDRFGIFDMSRAGIRLEPVRGGDEDEVELVLKLKERGRLFIKGGTEVGGGEGGVNGTVRILNALGGAESIEANASMGTKTKSAYQIMLSTPVLASPLLTFALSAFSLDRDNTAFASHREQAQGGRAKLSAITPWGNHDLTYELVQREIGQLSPNASVSIRELAHPSTKSSISHSWTSDTRDDPWIGTSGRLLKATHEYAGLPGSSEFAHFFKSTTQSQLSRALYPGSNIHFSLSSLTTLLLPLYQNTAGRSADGSPRATYLPDRAYLGGPNSMRGWKVGGVGLRDGPDSLGGDLAWALGLSVFAPIPKKEHWPLKLHSFLNVGKVVSYDGDRSFTDNIVKAYRQPNLSVGLGLLYRFDPLRVEFNFSVPLIGRKGERLARGFGIGVGIEFL